MPRTSFANKRSHLPTVKRGTAGARRTTSAGSSNVVLLSFCAVLFLFVLLLRALPGDTDQSFGDIVRRILTASSNAGPKRTGKRDSSSDAPPAPSTFLCPSASVLKIRDPPFGLSYFNDGVPCYVSGAHGGDAYEVDVRRTFSYCYAYSNESGLRLYGGGDKVAVHALLSSLPAESSPALCATAFCNCPYADACMPDLAPAALDDSRCVHAQNTLSDSKENASRAAQNNGAGGLKGLRGGALPVSERSR